MRGHQRSSLSCRGDPRIKAVWGGESEACHNDRSEEITDGDVASHSYAANSRIEGGRRKKWEFDLNVTVPWLFPLRVKKWFNLFFILMLKDNRVLKRHWVF